MAVSTGRGGGIKRCEGVCVWLPAALTGCCSRDKSYERSAWSGGTGWLGLGFGFAAGAQRRKITRTDVDLLFAFPRFPSLILSKAVSVSEEAQRIYSYQPSWTAIRDQADNYVFLRDINSKNCNSGGRLREGCRPRDALIDSIATASVTSGCEVVCPAKATAERCE